MTPPTALPHVQCNKQSPTEIVQKLAFGGRPILKLNPEMTVEIPEQTFFCSEFHDGFNGAKTRFVYPTVWEVFGNENGKIGIFRIFPSRKHRLSQPKS
jgi:hypothetical protein